ncbi:MAG TPA: tryptophan synthase subunit alpha [bacterium]|nr:tryptophan synthase subunit alpha [bacterium]
MTIAEKLRILERRNERALAVFATAGDPDLNTSTEIFGHLGDWGADIIEIGIPYSDPLMDGPVLQRSYLRALKHGFKLSQLAKIVEKTADKSDTPILIMTCYNPVYKYGVNRFFRDVKSAGVDSILLTDLPPEEWGESIELAKQFKLGTIFLIAPTTPIGRMEMISKISNPFVYCISKMGVTGAGAELPDELQDYVKFVQDTVKQPIMVGFGISTPEQAAQASVSANGVIVGSAAVAIIERHLDDKVRMFSLLENFISGIKNSLKPKD